MFGEGYIEFGEDFVSRFDREKRETVDITDFEVQLRGLEIEELFELLDELFMQTNSIVQYHQEIQMSLYFQ